MPYEGSNCEIKVAAPSVAEVQSGDTTIVAGSMAGAVVVLFCIGLIVYRQRMHAIQMKAFDFKAQIAKLIDAGEIDKNVDKGVPREIKRSHVTMTDKIGEGAFGDVRTFHTNTHARYRVIDTPGSCKHKHIVCSRLPLATTFC